MTKLSTGEWYKKVPIEPVANVQFRIKLLKACAADPVLRAGILEICRNDLIFWIACFAWQFNPKKKGVDAVGPFIPWDFQIEGFLSRPDTHGKKGILWAYENDRPMVVEKSRELGASWCFLLFQVWLCLFQKHVQCLNISKSADAVDDKSPDSLFWKIRHIHEHLPDWMKGEIVQEKFYFGYRKTKSHNTGVASTGRAGVGGRASVIFIDEFSQIKEATEVRQRTAGTSDCRFFNGTHLGVGTEFYNLTASPEFPKLVWHWSQHPEKKKGLYHYDQVTNKVAALDKTYQYPPDFKFVTDGLPTGGPFPGLRSPWYDWKVIDIGNPRGVAMELDIDPKGAARNSSTLF